MPPFARIIGRSGHNGPMLEGRREFGTITRSTMLGMIPEHKVNVEFIEGLSKVEIHSRRLGDDKERLPGDKG